ncbi:MAG: hypothetical protein CL678_15970 [Bdellovibrionaceae bacterium]|nr:hypothetical protein [Pseudobdellovibrionaceae bacterium]
MSSYRFKHTIVRAVINYTGYLHPGDLHMNIIQKALDEVRFTIPVQLLELAFIRQERWAAIQPTSLDYRIRQKVIDSRVLVDCNLVGGIQDNVSLAGLPAQWVDSPYSAIFRIPKERTGGKVITTALSVGYGPGGLSRSAYFAPTQQSPLVGAAEQIIGGVSPIPQVNSAYVDLIGENTVYVRDTLALPLDLSLRCILTNDSEMNNIKPASYHAFCKLVVLATKAYIHNTLKVLIDLGQINAGQSVGTILDKVDEYADANELYEVHLEEVWRATAYLNDGTSKKRHLSMIVGGGF